MVRYLKLYLKVVNKERLLGPKLKTGLNAWPKCFNNNAYSDQVEDPDEDGAGPEPHAAAEPGGDGGEAAHVASLFPPLLRYSRHCSQTGRDGWRAFGRGQVVLTPSRIVRSNPAQIHCQQQTSPGLIWQQLVRIRSKNS